MLLASRRVLTDTGFRPAALAIRAGRIENILPYPGPPLDRDGRAEDLGDLVLLPGLVDSHVHVNDPGRADWEGFDRATAAAAAGGITTIVDMPLNSSPVTTTVAALEAKRAALEGRARVDVGLWGGIVPGNAPEIVPLARAGVLGFKAFLSPSGIDEFPHVSHADLERALPRVAETGLPLLVHAEDPAILATAADPACGRRYDRYLATRPAEAEVSAIGYLIDLARRSSVPIHVVHVSSGAGALLIAEAQAEGVPISGETCPHYLTFAAEEIEEGATAYKCAPPIRQAAERDRLWEALTSGALSLVASDHSPCPPALKRFDSGDFAKAWGGVAGLELMLPAVWTGARRRGLPLERVSEWLSSAPARLAGLESRKGWIAPGYDADLVAFAPDDEWVVDPARLHQRHRVTPYAGRALTGRVHTTWLRGREVFHEGAARDAQHGRWLRGGT